MQSLGYSSKKRRGGRTFLLRGGRHGCCTCGWGCGIDVDGYDAGEMWISELYPVKKRVYTGYEGGFAFTLASVTSLEG
jgi:hypothetical protein